MTTETEILRKNVKELQIQLRDAHIRIKELNLTINTLRNRLGSEIEYTTADGWAMPIENPEAIHIKKGEEDDT
tara:strand:+ start:103 stop:321 length:219 start_codon:yes stop_codon:yes gene_type:complete